MNEKLIFQILKQALKRSNCRINDVKKTDTLTEDLGLHPDDFPELLRYLAKYFKNPLLSELDPKQWNTVGDILTSLQNAIVKRIIP